MGSTPLMPSYRMMIQSTHVTVCVMTKGFVLSPDAHANTLRDPAPPAKMVQPVPEAESKGSPELSLAHKIFT